MCIRDRFSVMEPQPLGDLAPGASPLELDMLVSLLSPDPEKRPNTHGALHSDYFLSRPLPMHQAELAECLFVSEGACSQQGRGGSESRSSQLAALLAQHSQPRHDGQPLE
eukprot:TRINITY_DN36181_c0_g1_i2.p1 TRINITY_DN36181_c0_g1~~TRINITY_DN36181_c0_g1_i2.p1  ORF type:complete len:110 (-),score=15.41 TRINITY_DN36181_c0_g1_i2:292-621(-)